ncbi:DUF6087 family protein [Streptomyces sp. NPDC127084]|uniref:DUF6087 family protein n=1 Tax=Streptomyces sp. NPDC127084 TaxID=3347133 RepID=UPI00365C8408
MDDEEPLAEWARKRDERREQARGRLRAVPLTEGPHRAAHVAPGAPRAIQEFDGTGWVTVGVAADLAAAKAILFPPQPPEERPVEWDRPALGKGRGRHRKPAASDERDR